MNHIVALCAAADGDRGPYHRTMVQLSAIVPATDSPPTLDRCLAAIAAAIDPPEELIVIDEPVLMGPAAARNLGARHAKSDVLVFVDSDVAVHPEAFAKIRRTLDDNDEKLTATFGSYDDNPDSGGLVSDFRNLLHHHVHQQGAGPATTFWAGLGAVRRADFLACGGFDEERFPKASIEDIELGMRLVQRGRRILLDPTLQGKHLKHWTLRSMIRTDLFNRGAPWVELLLERRSGSTALNLGWRHRTSVLASLALAAGLVTRRPALAATSLSAILVLNRSFYVLLARRGGTRLVAAGVVLHVVHHLLSATAVPVGLAGHLGGGLVPPRTSSE